DAHQVLAVMALRQGDIDGTIGHLQIILDDRYGDVNQNLWMVVNLLGREKDVELVMAVMERLLEQFRDNSDAVYALANIAARLGRLDRAQELLELTIEMVPENDNAAMSYISILQRKGQVNTALKWLEQVLLQRKSNDFTLRLAYARLLTDARRLDDARRQFEILSVSAPNNIDVLYALGLLYLQSNRLDEAEAYFKRLSNQNKRPNEAFYYLGRIREERKDYKKASIWYQGVQKGDNYFDAQIRLGLIKAKLGSTDDARKHLRGIQARGEEDKTVLTQAEAELLIDEKRYEEAMEVYDKALAGQYNSELFYSRAMLAEKMGRIDILEKDLRTILAKEPDHSQALNALGYTLADRTDRHEEAYLLIKRALELSPEDFYILDSMGWVLYRLGRHQEAIEYLRKAMSVRRDPEIAAHFGEVLWVSGDRKAAKEIWETALEETPDDEEEELLNVIKRFRP
ncbi:MAG: tetratricopeptide repeat protein, partial [Gammaproteobacteria bacterium]|nr:tetratricopeptide repeat protein [Gammaproteobacteria bacterium]